MNNLNKLIRLLESSSCEEKFGKYLFGEFEKFYGSVKETDTDYEKKIWRLVIDFVQGEHIGKEKDAILLKAFTELQNCQKEFPSILVSKKLNLYRGIPMDKKEYDSIIPTLKKKPVKLPGIDDNPLLQGTYLYKSKSKIQSWTSDARSAFGFSFPLTSGTGKYPVILKYKFSLSDTLFNIKFLNKVGSIYIGAQGEIEDEIVRMGDKPIKCNAYILEDYEPD